MGIGEEPSFETFAEGLRLLRLHRLMTQEELAERAQISVRAVRDAEAGRSRRPHRGTVTRLVKALDLPAETHDRMIDCARAGHASAAHRADAAPRFGDAAPRYEDAVPRYEDAVPRPGDALVVVLRCAPDTVGSTITVCVSISFRPH